MGASPPMRVRRLQCGERKRHNSDFMAKLTSLRRNMRLSSGLQS